MRPSILELALCPQLFSPARSTTLRLPRQTCLREKATIVVALEKLRRHRFRRRRFWRLVIGNHLFVRWKLFGQIFNDVIGARFNLDRRWCLGDRCPRWRRRWRHRFLSRARRRHGRVHILFSVSLFCSLDRLSFSLALSRFFLFFGEHVFVYFLGDALFEQRPKDAPWRSSSASIGRLHPSFTFNILNFDGQIGHHLATNDIERSSHQTHFRLVQLITNFLGNSS